MLEIADGASVSQPMSSRSESDKSKLRKLIAESLRQSMNKLFEEPVFCDLKLESDDGVVFSAHKCVVKARAPDFYTSYVQQNYEGPTSAPIVRISGVSGAKLKSFLKRVYTDERVPHFNLSAAEFSDDDSDAGGGTTGNTEETTTPISTDVFAAGETTALVDPLSAVDNNESCERYVSSCALTTSTTENVELPSSGQAAPLQTSYESQLSHRTFTLEQRESITSTKTVLGQGDENAAPKTSFVDLASSLVLRDAGRETSPPAGGSRTFRAGGDQRLMSSSADAQRFGDGSSGAKMFNMFIDLGATASIVANGVSSRSDAAINLAAVAATSPPLDELGDTPRPVLRSQNSRRKRWSVTSLRSLGSSTTELTTASPGSKAGSCISRNLVDGKMACSKLGADLLSTLFGGSQSAPADVVLHVNGQEFQTHKALLSTTCEYFRSLLTDGQVSIHLPDYIQANTVKFALNFFYGGVIDVPEDVDVWNIVDFAKLVQSDTMLSAACLHIKSRLCHYFHKPCPSCSTNVVECIEKLRKAGLDELMLKCVRWQAKYFVRIWKTKAFQQLNDVSLKTCCDELAKMTDVDNVIDVLLGYEKLQHDVYTMTSKQANVYSSKKTVTFYESLLSDLRKSCLSFIALHFPTVLSSEAFLTLGRGYALNLGFVEDILPCIIRDLTPEVGCKTLRKLYDLLSSLSSSSSPENEYNERFVSMLKRLYEMCDAHLIHRASLVVHCGAWSDLTDKMQQRIKDTGIFVDMKQPTALPPKLSSFNRQSHKQRSSTSVDRESRADVLAKKRYSSAKPDEVMVEVENQAQSTVVDVEDSLKTPQDLKSGIHSSPVAPKRDSYGNGPAAKTLKSKADEPAASHIRPPVAVKTSSSSSAATSVSTVSRSIGRAAAASRHSVTTTRPVIAASVRKKHA